MKIHYKLLALLSLFTFCCLNSTTAEARACFVVGQCGDDATDTNVSQTKNCEALGYTITAEECEKQGKITVGPNCEGFYHGCACDISKYPYLEGENHSPYILTGDQCQDDNGVHRRYKVCSSEFKYSGTCFEKQLSLCLANTYNEYVPITDVSYTEHSSCPYNSVPSGNSCREDFPVDLINFSIDGPDGIKFAATGEEKWTTCSCDLNTYKYLKDSSFDAAVFVLDEDNACIDLDNITHYASVQCKGLQGNATTYYGETCADGYIYDSEDDVKLNNIYTCHKCTKRTCDTICASNTNSVDQTGYTSTTCINKIKDNKNPGKYCKKQDMDNCYCLESGGTCPTNWYTK